MIYLTVLLGLSITANAVLVFFYLRFVKNLAMLYKSRDVIDYEQYKLVDNAKSVVDKHKKVRKELSELSDDAFTRVIRRGK